MLWLLNDKAFHLTPTGPSVVRRVRPSWPPHGLPGRGATWPGAARGRWRASRVPPGAGHWRSLGLRHGGGGLLHTYTHTPSSRSAVSRLLGARFAVRPRSELATYFSCVHSLTTSLSIRFCAFSPFTFNGTASFSLNKMGLSIFDTR